MTPIADMVDGMMAKGASPEAIAAAVRAMETALPDVTERYRNALPKERSRNAVKQAAYRERTKAKQQDGVALAVDPAPVTHPVTPGNAVTESVTNAPLSILPFLSASQEQPKEEKKQELNTEPRAKAKRQRGAGTRMTEDWYPDAKGMKIATDRGLRLVEIEIEITKFRNYWINRTDRDSSKPRWDLAWENWILNVKGTTNAGANGNRANSNAGFPQTHGDAVMAGMARYAAGRREGKSAASREGFCGRDDAPADNDADRRTARGDREPSKQLALVPPRNAGKS